MFENLLGQDALLARLRSDLETASLPRSLLFSGPPASGKLTAALELARVLSCAGAYAGGVSAGGASGAAPASSGGLVAPVRGAWNCPCPACARHRLLIHPDLLLMGPRTFPEEIQAGLELLARAPGKPAAYFFVRAVRKLAKRFDAALYEGEEARLAKAAPLLRELEERLDAVRPEAAGAGSGGAAGSAGATGFLAEGALEAAEAAAKAALKLEALVPDAPPVFQIRSAESWARLAPRGERKCIVIEAAESMQDSARNALLKILEEPPESLVFVLVSSRPSALIRTILSRVRNYRFAARDAAASALVLERVFREPAGALAAAAAPRASNAVEAYLAARRPFPPARAKELAARLLGALLAEEGGIVEASPPLAALAQGAREGGEEALAALLEASKDFGQKDEAYAASFDAFLSGFAELLGDLLREPELGARGEAAVARWAELAREARDRRRGYNLSASLLAEGLATDICRAARELLGAVPARAREGAVAGARA